MNVGISALFHASGGSLTHLSRLLVAWDAAGVLEQHRFFLFASESTLVALRGTLPADLLAKLTVEVDRHADRGLVARLWSEQIALPRRLRAHRADVVFCPANVVPYASRIPSVVVFQNAAPFCESVTFRSLHGGRWWLRFRLLEYFVRASARRANKVIFLSQWFRDLFVRRFAFPIDRGEVVPHASAALAGARRDEAVERTLGIQGPYLLCVSHLNPYKNMLELIEAFGEIAGDPEMDPTSQLVIAGMTNFPWYRTAIEDLIVQRRLTGRVVLTGLVGPGEVGALLAGCEGFAFASTCESFSIALIEALSCGVAIAASRAGVVPEIAGDAALYFDPDDPRDIAETLRMLWRDHGLRESLRQRARSRAAEMPGEMDVARMTLRVIEAAAGEKRR